VSNNPNDREYTFWRDTARSNVTGFSTCSSFQTHFFDFGEDNGRFAVDRPTGSSVETHFS
jgi:hypothetical protein